MNNRHKQLILEIMLLQEKYSVEEMRHACDILASNELGPDISKVISLLSANKGEEKSRKSGNRVASKASYVPKEDIIKKLRQSSNSTRYHLITDLSSKLNMDKGENYRPSIDEIIDKIISLSEKEYINKFFTKISGTSHTKNLEPDSDYIGLANFIMGVDRNRD